MEQESLAFNGLGQWTLLKSTVVDPTKENYHDYHSPKRGELPADHGTRGRLSPTTNHKKTHQMSNDKMNAKTPIPRISQYHADHPYFEDDSASPNIDRI